MTTKLFPGVLACGLFGLAPAQDQQVAQVGDQVAEFTFGPMLNGDGRAKLSEFRGQPILIDFWGTR